ncbi:MAG TPA: M90 family metallopeptidase, partial [Gemmataceae bacterium]|nr:M90 family metallopeptidase [Gemmataceae bacterium]
RRRNLLAEPFPVRWEAILKRNVGHYPLLSPPEQARLRDITRVLIAEKAWEGCGGLFVSEEMKVTIAASASLLLLGADHDYYHRVASVVLYPTTFRTPRPEDDWEDDELSDTILAGQAVYRGPVILSWDEVLAEARDPEAGYNVVLHEFAHQLDFLDNAINGTPPLDDPELEKRWRYVMTVAFEDHRRLLKRGKEEPFFTEHAAENETEFFADATEAFYCRPEDMQELYPDVYQLLAAYYRVDPVKWFANTGP